MKNSSPIIRFTVIQLTALALLVTAWVLGWLQQLFVDDKTYITTAIAIVTLIGLMNVARGKWAWVDWIVTALPLLGLLGTFIGIKIAVTGVEGGEVALRDLGVGTALNTTITGMFGALWVGLSERFLR